MHVQVCTLCCFFLHQFTYLEIRSPQGVHVCAVCSLALEEKDGGVQLVYAGHMLLARDRDVIIHMRKDRGFVCILIS